ncbi:hypothetical protein LguiA_010610 [Lonicera macranthoides]
MSRDPLPRQLCFFLLTLFMFICFIWYINYESIFEGLFDHLKFLLILSPLALLLVVHLLNTFDDTDGGRSLFFFSMPEKDSFNRAGGTPWGVGFILVLLLFLVSYQSNFRERWFPFLSR